MKTVIRKNYTPKTLEYCDTIVVDSELSNVFIFDSDGVYTKLAEVKQPEEL